MSFRVRGNTPPDGSPPSPHRHQLRRSVSAAYNISQHQSVAKNFNTDAKFETEYEVVKELGEGGFGKVFKAKNVVDGMTYAVKECHFFFDVGADNKDMEALRIKALREAQMIGKLDHPNVVRYHSCWVEDLGLQVCDNDSEDEFSDEDCMFDAEDMPEDDNLGLGSPPLLVRQNGQFEMGYGTNNQNVFRLRSGRRLSPVADSDVIEDERSTEKKPVMARQPSQKSTGSNKSLKHQLNLYIQMACYETDTLKEFLERRATISREENLSILKQLLSGLVYVHHSGLIHRDLKPPNIFLIYDGKRKSQNVRVLIGDFGLAMNTSRPVLARKASKAFRRLSALGNLSFSSVGSESPDKAGALQNQSYDADLCVGTETYAAIEQLEGKSNISDRADIYSLGIIMTELFCQFGSYMERGKVIDDARTSAILPVGMREKFPQESELAVRMLCHTPRKRPSAEEALASTKKLMNDLLVSRAAKTSQDRKQKVLAIAEKLAHRTKNMCLSPPAASTVPAHFSDRNSEKPTKYLKSSDSISINEIIFENNEGRNCRTFQGIVGLDKAGTATVIVECQQQASPQAFTYNLTAMLAPMPSLHVSKEAKFSKESSGILVFSIGGGVPHGRVSWQLIGN
jgi:serine/threonine protein kinase